jgi:hypothetical protein
VLRPVVQLNIGGLQRLSTTAASGLSVSTQPRPVAEGVADELRFLFRYVEHAFDEALKHDEYALDTESAMKDKAEGVNGTSGPAPEGVMNSPIHAPTTAPCAICPHANMGSRGDRRLSRILLQMFRTTATPAPRNP